MQGGVDGVGVASGPREVEVSWIGAVSCGGFGVAEARGQDTTRLLEGIPCGDIGHGRDRHQFLPVKPDQRRVNEVFHFHDILDTADVSSRPLEISVRVAAGRTAWT